MSDLGQDDSGIEWDDGFAHQLLGATLFVGVTYLDHDGTLIRREQVFGRVETVDPEAGITILPFDGAAPFTMVPILEAIEPADPGAYQLTPEDPVVENPDYTVIFSLTAPLRH
ncbi:hypothetical protein [Methylobacterium goesingense]|uniref:Uncharacterized protein n=1 Tax=Methylobacterium goesingense TaxID=243690 RepID=A0ABV2L1P3_9HYPH|nr:hypothetical protein [Methylobacterium goesingense]GJD72646.1 hypothetical protein CFIICLFH_0865 [Methylobacterium goesingense]